jgi:hypothetical protein
MARNSSYSVNSVTEVRLPWLARRKVAEARRGRRTGLVLHGIIRTPPRGVTTHQPIVPVHESGHRLCMASPWSKFPKWVALPPGRHVLRFVTTRSTFEKEIEIPAGQTLVAVCEPVQPRTIFAPSPPEDRWYVGLV